MRFWLKVLCLLSSKKVRIKSMISPSGKISLANGESEKRYVYREINNGQATKGARRMPWHWEPMKDVVSCDKPWGGANIL